MSAVATGLVAVMYARLIDFGYDTFLRFTAIYWWLPLVITPAIAAFCVWVTRCFFPGSEGSGIPQVIATLRVKYHLDQPVPTQYALWVRDVAHGDLGSSLRTDVPVRSLIAQKLPVTLQLAVMAMILAIGIGSGSMLAGRLSGDKIELGLVPLGSLGLGVFSLILVATGSQYWLAAVMLVILGISGGFFAVPLNALLQQRPEDHELGRVLATNNVLNTVGMLLAAGAFWALGDWRAYLKSFP